MKTPRGSLELSKPYQNPGSQVMPSATGSMPIPRLHTHPQAPNPSPGSAPIPRLHAHCQAGNSGDHRKLSNTDSRLEGPGLVSSHHRQTPERTLLTRGTRTTWAPLWGFGNYSDLLTKSFLKRGLSLCGGWQDGLLRISYIR